MTSSFTVAKNLTFSQVPPFLTRVNNFSLLKNALEKNLDTETLMGRDGFSKGANWKLEEQKSKNMEKCISFIRFAQFINNEGMQAFYIWKIYFKAFHPFISFYVTAVFRY